MKWIIVLTLAALSLSACSDDPSDPTESNHPANNQPSQNAPNNQDECVCHDDADPCCDGCDAVDVGEACDDGLDCTLETRCTDLGYCGDADASPCDDQVDHADCVASSCDELEGCSFEHIRQGLDCETDTDDLRVIDGTCQAGECVGTTCTCDAESACCDGCVPIEEGEACDDGDEWTIDETCQEGQCVGVELECDDADPCCDGGFFVEADTICDDEAVDGYMDCAGPNVRVSIEVFKACSGDSAQCTEDHTVEVEGGEFSCPQGDLCYTGVCA